MQHIPSTPLAEAFAALRQNCARLPPAQALAVALLLRLLASLESLARLWRPAARPRRPYRSGKGPQLRDWMAPCHPTRKLRPLPPRPPKSPRARELRAPARDHPALAPRRDRAPSLRLLRSP
jgi:hypothetical protein